MNSHRDALNPPCRPRRRTGWATLLLAALLLAGGDDLAAQHFEAHGTVQFSLERKRIVDPLPFDVPFYLLTPLPAGWTSSARTEASLTAASKKGSACAQDKALSAVDSYDDCRDFPQPRSTCGLTAEHVKAPISNEGNDVDQIRLSMPKLNPRRDYCISLALLRAPTPEERKTLETSVGAVVGEFARELDGGHRVADQEGLEALCTSIKNVINRSLAGKGLEAIPKDGATIEGCLEGELLFSEVVEETAWGNLRTQLSTAVTNLLVIAKSLPADSDLPRAKEIRALELPTDARSFLLGLKSGEVPILLTEEQAKSSRKNVAELRSSYPLDGLDCDTVKSTSEPAKRLACFAGDELDGLEVELDSLERALTMANGARDAALEVLAVEIVKGYDVAATTWADFQGRFAWYRSLDTGVAHAWELDKSFAYTGANFYSTPVNKKAPLRSFKLRESWRRRIALLFGMSNSKIDEPGIEPHFEDRFILLGGGIRLTDHIRFNSGVILFDEVNPDPLVDTRLGEAYSPFLSLSLDVNVASAFKNLFSTAGGDG